MRSVADPCEGATSDDGRLVKLARSRTAEARAAFGLLVTRHKDWLYNYLLCLLRAPGIADDAAQETLLRAWQALDGLADADRFRPWLRTIATRTAFNLRRARQTRARYEESSPSPAATPDVHDLAETEELMDRALQGLSYAYREVLVLRYIEELPMAEIATNLELSDSALKMRLMRARNEFARIYERLGGDPR